MGEIFKDPPIKRNPENCTQNPEHCDFDIKAVCKAILFQNQSGTLLRDFEISKEEIVLTYEIPD